MKDQLERRPLLIAAFSLVIGLSSLQHPLNLLALPPLLYFVRGKRAWIVTGLSLAVGLLLAPRPLPILYEKQFVSGPLIVQSIPHERSSKTGEDQIADGFVAGLRVRFHAPDTPILRLGDVLGVSGVLQPVSEIAETDYRNEGIQATLQLRQIRFLKRSPKLVEYPADVRRDYGAFVEANMSPEDAQLTKAVWFRADSLPQDEQNQILRSGAYGYFASAGIQVYMLCAVLMGLLSLVRIPRAWQAPVVAVVLAVFTVATGLHAGTFRASLACVIFLWSFRMAREPDALSSLSLAAISYLLLFPRAIYSIGFQMSMAIVAAICLFVHLDSPDEPSFWTSLLQRGKQLLAVCLAIWLAGEPVVAAHFGNVELGTLPAILLLHLALSAVLLCSLFAYLVHWLWLGLAVGLLNLCVLPLEHYIFYAISWLANHDLNWSTPFFNPYWLVLYYGAWLMTWRPRAIRP